MKHQKNHFQKMLLLVCVDSKGIDKNGQKLNDSFNWYGKIQIHYVQKITLKMCFMYIVLELRLS